MSEGRDEEKRQSTDMTTLEEEYIRRSENYQPWIPRSPATKSEQDQFKIILERRAGARFLGEDIFVSTEAFIYTHFLSIKKNSIIAGGAVLRGYIEIGENCSINPFAHIAGKVSLGNGVRVAGLASIYGFNHGFARVDIPIYQQAHTTVGVTVGDGTWIGVNAVIVDGVSIGCHCIIAGGAVVTKNVPDYSIVGGNPAKVVRNRKGNVAVDSGQQSSLKQGSVRRMLFEKSPYEDVPFTFPPDTQGWDSNHAIFKEVISEVQPSLIVEVGTWKGASALHMAQLCQELGLYSEIVCVDTWLGNWQHWSRGSGGIGSREDLKIVNGFPRLYYQFLANVIHHGFEGVITPLPLTGVAAAKLFEHFDLRPDIVYIDGDHEYESVLFDLRLWMKRLSPRGVLIGDDYGWPTVRRAVEECAREGNYVLQVSGLKFTLRPNPTIVATAQSV